MQLPKLGADQPASAVGPVHLDLHSGPGLEAHGGVRVLVAGPECPDPPCERGVGALVAELLQLAVEGRRPKIVTAMKPSLQVRQLRLGELGRTLPGSVAGNDL